jgi:hypothetical protein
MKCMIHTGCDYRVLQTSFIRMMCLHSAVNCKKNRKILDKWCINVLSLTKRSVNNVTENQSTIRRDPR